MDGKRKVSDDAPGSSRLPPPKRREEGSDEASNAGEESGDSDSNMTLVSDYSEGSDLAGELAGALNIQPPNQVPVELEDPAAADGQHAEAEVQLPPPPPPKRREDGIDEASNAGNYSGDSDSNMTYVSDYSEGGDLAGQLAGALNIQPPNQVPAESEELAAADGQHAEVEVQPPPPPADQHAAAEVSDQSVAASAPVPDMVVPAAESALCLGCEREPALERLVPVKHACLCLTCRSNPSGVPYCEYCDGPRR